MLVGDDMNNNEFKIFCKKISELRKENKLCKSNMAKKLHISIKTLDKIEMGVMPAKLNTEILF